MKSLIHIQVTDLNHSLLRLMLVTAISLQLEIIRNGQVKTLTPSQNKQYFQVDVNFSIETDVVIRMEPGALIKFAVCKTINTDCIDDNVLDAEIPYSGSLIRQQYVNKHTFQKPGIYFLELMCQEVNKCSANVSVTTGALITDHMTTVIHPIKFQSLLPASQNLSYYQFLFYICPDKDLPTQVATILRPGSDNKTVTKFYLSQDAGVGFPDPDNCLRTNITLCGMSDVTDSPLSNGLWKVVITYEGQLSIDTLLLRQRKFVAHDVNGIEFVEWLSTAEVCGSYIELDISKINDTDIVSLTGIAAHSTPLQDGAVTLTVSDYDQFNSNAIMNLEGTFSYTDGGASYDLRHLREMGISKLYVMVNQRETEYIHHVGAPVFTEVALVVCWNLYIQPVDQTYSGRLLPYATGEKNTTVIEKGTMRFGYNFLYYQPNFDIAYLNGSISHPPVQNWYTFRTISSHDVDLNQFVHHDHVGSFIHHLSEFEKFNTDAMDAGVSVTIKASSSTNIAIPEVAEGDSMFATVKLMQTTDTKKDKLYSYRTSAAVLAEVPAETVVDINAMDVTYNGKQWFFKVQPTLTTKEKKGYHLKVTGCNHMYVGVMYSSRNTIPDINDNAGMSDPDLKRNTVDLIIPGGDKPIYVAVNAEDPTEGRSKCDKVSFYSYAMGVNTTRFRSDEVIEAQVNGSNTLQYEFLLDGTSFNQPEAFFKLEIVPKTMSTIKYSLDFAITTKLFLGNAEKAPKQDTLAKGSIFATSMTKEAIIRFSNRQNAYLYLTITRSPEQSDNEQCDFIFQVSHPSLLKNGKKHQLPAPERSGFQYTMIDVRADDELNFTFYSTTIGKDVGMYYLCPYAFPFISELYARCKKNAFKNGESLIIHNTDGNHYIGKNFLVIHIDELGIDTISIQTQINRDIPMAKMAEFKMTGEGPLHLVAKLLKGTTAKSQIVLTLINCDECAVCASLSKSHPRLDPFKTNLTEMIDCSAIVGNVMEDNRTQKLYNKTAVFEFGNPVMKDAVYFTVISLSAEGIVEQVDLVVDQLTPALTDTNYTVDMKFSDRTEVYDPNQGTTYYSATNYKFEMNCAKLERLNYSTLTVAPDINAPNMTLLRVQNSYYSVYASLTDIIPSYSKSSYHTLNEQGISVLTLRNDEIIDKCGNNTVVPLYVQVRAAPELVNITKTIIHLASGNKENVAYPLKFSSINTMKMTEFGKRKLFYFDVVTRPISFTLTACRGFPQLRAGITDYYMRSTYSSPTFNNSKENVFKSENTTYGEDIVFQIRPGSVQRSVMGDWILEVGDWRTPVGETKEFWSADLFVGNADPRPGIPIRSFQFGKRGAKYEVRFAPGVPVGKQLNQSMMEYAFFIMPNLKEKQDTAYNPKQACGFMQGGLQMNNWTVFKSWQDKYVLSSEVSDQEIAQYVANSKTNDYYVSIVGKQRDTGLSDSYIEVPFDITKPPGPIDIPSETSGALTGILVSVGVIVVIALCIGGFFYYRARANKQVYEAKTNE